MEQIQCDNICSVGTNDHLEHQQLCLRSLLLQQSELLKMVGYSVRQQKHMWVKVSGRCTNTGNHRSLYVCASLTLVITAQVVPSSGALLICQKLGAFSPLKCAACLLLSPRSPHPHRPPRTLLVHAAAEQNRPVFLMKSSLINIIRAQ